MGTVVTILVQDVAVPELLALLHKGMPTDSQMVIQLDNRVTSVKAVGQAFLDQTTP